MPSTIMYTLVKLFISCIKLFTTGHPSTGLIAAATINLKSQLTSRIYWFLYILSLLFRISILVLRSTHIIIHSSNQLSLSVVHWCILSRRFGPLSLQKAPLVLLATLSPRAWPRRLAYVTCELVTYVHTVGSGLTSSGVMCYWIFPAVCSYLGFRLL